MIITIVSVVSIVIGLTANGFKLYQNVPTNEIKPWTGEWYKLCSERYKSFDHKTGLFTTHNGKRVFCRFRSK